MEPHYVMGTPVPPPPSHSHSSSWVAVEFTPVSPQTSIGPTRNQPNYHLPPYTANGHGGGTFYTSPHQGNPYVHFSSTQGSYGSSDTIFKALDRFGKRLEVSTRKAADVAGSVWNHLKASPNLTDTAMSRLYQETRAYAEGGHDKIFKQTFGVLPGEQLMKSYACYLSTSAGPLVGTLYLSTARLAFCSDKPVSSSNSFQGYQGSTYYKVILRLDQLKTVNSPANIMNPAEKYIQIVTLDGQDFWFMGFVSYNKALKHMKEAVMLRASR